MLKLLRLTLNSKSNVSINYLLTSHLSSLILQSLWFHLTDRWCCLVYVSVCSFSHNIPDSKVHGANMGPIWVRQDPGGSHVGPVNFAVWDIQPLTWQNQCLRCVQNTTPRPCWWLILARPVSVIGCCSWSNVVFSSSAISKSKVIIKVILIADVIFMMMYITMKWLYRKPTNEIMPLNDWKYTCYTTMQFCKSCVLL